MKNLLSYLAVLVVGCIVGGLAVAGIDFQRPPAKNADRLLFVEVLLRLANPGDASRITAIRALHTSESATFES